MQNIFMACGNDFIVFKNCIIHHFGESEPWISNLEGKKVLAVLCRRGTLSYLYQQNEKFLVANHNNISRIQLTYGLVSNNFNFIINDTNFVEKVMSLYKGIFPINVLKYALAFGSNIIDDKFVEKNSQFKQIMLGDRCLIGLTLEGRLKIIQRSSIINVNNEKISAENILAVNSNPNDIIIMISCDDSIRVIVIQESNNSNSNMRKVRDITYSRVKQGVITSDSNFITLLFKDGTVHLYKYHEESKEYVEIICDQLNELSLVSDIVVTDNNAIGCLKSNGEIIKVELKIKLSI